jgi:hypothetical protein
LQRVIPLTLGYGASQFLFTADMLIVQNYFDDTAAYGFGGTLARAIVLFTGPLAAVMFPKLVERAAKAHKGGVNFLGVALLGTAVLSGLAAIGLTVLSPFIIQVASNPEFKSFKLIPLFAWCMVPLAVANVLLNNLMAHSRFKCVPVLVAVVVGYWFALQHFHDSFKMVIQTFGIFTLIFLGVCVAFTWAGKAEGHRE